MMFRIREKAPASRAVRRSIATRAARNTAARAVLLLVLSFILAMALTSCHGSKGLAAFSVPEEFDTSKHYEITFWAKNDTNKTQTNIYEKAIRDFNEYYPNIDVKIRFYTDYGKIYNDVITNISTGTTPNVCITYPDHIATYLTGNNVVVPLDDVMKNEKYGLGGTEVAFDGPGQDEVIPKFLDECEIGGVHYALPYMRSTEICYVNQDLVEKLGFELPDVLTWDYIFQVSDAAMEKDADGNFTVNGQKVMIPFIYKSTDNMMIQMLRQRDAGYSNEEGKIDIFNDTTKEILFEIAKHAKIGSFSTFKISSYPGNFLNAGQCIFAVDSSAGATWMGSHAPMQDIHESKIVEYNLRVFPVPQYDPANIKMISQGPSVCIFNKADSGEVMASWLFTQFLLTNDVQIAYAQTEGYVPVTSKAQEDATYQDYLNRAGEDNKQYYKTKIEATRLLLENTDKTFVTPVFNGSTSLRDASGQMIENVTKSVKRGQSVDEAYMSTLFEDVSSLYRLDQLGSGGLSGDEKDLGPLPNTAKMLLACLGLAWVFIAIYWLTQKKHFK